jgi:membrane protein required for colicin V production
MTVYDGAMLAVVLAGLVWGAIRGITWQLASMASLVLGYMVAYPVSGQIASSFPGPPAAARALALLACYAGVSAGVFGVAWMVRTTLRQWKFEAYDRHLGMLLGGMEGATLGIVATVFVVSLAPQTRTPILTSTAGRAVCQVLDVVEPILPSEIRAELSPFWSGSDATSVASKPAVPPSAVPDDQSPPPVAPAADAASADQAIGALKQFVAGEEKKLEQSLGAAAEQQLNQLTGQPNGRTVERR